MNIYGSLLGYFRWKCNSNEMNSEQKQPPVFFFYLFSEWEKKIDNTPEIFAKYFVIFQYARGSGTINR